MILGMERITDAGRQIAAAVFDADGRLQGWQTRNQLDPSEEAAYVPGDTRRIFEVNGLKFGVTICHEAFRLRGRRRGVRGNASVVARVPP